MAELRLCLCGCAFLTFILSFVFFAGRRHITKFGVVVQEEDTSPSLRLVVCVCVVMAICRQPAHTCWHWDWIWEQNYTLLCALLADV
jgi:hypothetical protein